MSLCTFCGTQHDTSACPPSLSPNVIYEQSGKRILSGLTFGEYEICRRLDTIIKLLNNE